MRRLDTMFEELHITELTVNIASVPSNGTITQDIPATGVALGTHIISWEPVTDATTIEDLLLQFMVVDTNLIRATYSNPTGGAIDPDPIDFQFFTGIARAEIVE